MTTPPTKTKWTYVYNDMLEALYQAKLNGIRFKIMLYVIRKTNGFHQATITASNAEIASAIDSSREHVARERTWLKKHNYLVKANDDTDQAVGIIAVQENVSLWGTTSEQSNTSASLLTSEQSRTSEQSVTQPSEQSRTSPTPPYKEERNLKKDPPPRARTERQKPLGLKPFKPPPDETHLGHPAVKAAVETLKRTPTATQQALIADTVTDLSCWQSVLRLWVANNYNLDRIGDMLDRYGKDVGRTDKPDRYQQRTRAPDTAIPNTAEYTTYAEMQERVAEHAKSYTKFIPGKPT